MKYIVVGLGNFGASLAKKLTAQGHEVIGVDMRMERVDHYKERISHTICMDSTDEFAVAGLPLEDTDIVIVAIGKEQGANIMTTALFKNLQVKRLVSRALNSLHEKVLQAIGVDEIVHPEEETAGRWARKLCLDDVIDSFELSPDFSIVEARLPTAYVGSTIRKIGFRENFNLLVLTTIRKSEVKSIIGKSRTIRRIQDVPNPDQELDDGDIVVLYGSNVNLQKFLKMDQG